MPPDKPRNLGIKSAILPYIPLREMVHLICPKCGRRGRYRRERYIEIAGTEVSTAALIPFARAMGCELAIRQSLDRMDNPCGIRYDLAAKAEWMRQRGEKDC